MADKSNVYILSYAFNQDFSCFLAGTTRGFRVYTLNPVSEVHRRETGAITAGGEEPGVTETTSKDVGGAVCVVAMLYKTNIFPIVRLSGAPDSSLGAMGDPNHGEQKSFHSNRVQIWDDNRSSVVGELSNRHEVRQIVLRRDVIVMVCEYSIYM